MPRVTLQHIGKLNGHDVWAPLASSDFKAIEGQRYIVCDVKGPTATRTELQRRSIWLYCTHLAKALNDAGYGMRAVFSKLFKADLPWTKDSAKEALWAEVQDQLYQTRSTADLERDQVSMVYDAINQATSERLGVSVSFPDRLMLQYEQEQNN